MDFAVVEEFFCGFYGFLDGVNRTDKIIGINSYINGGIGQIRLAGDNDVQFPRYHCQGIKCLLFVFLIQRFNGLFCLGKGGNGLLDNRCPFLAGHLAGFTLYLFGNFGRSCSLSFVCTGLRHCRGGKQHGSGRQ